MKRILDPSFRYRPSFATDVRKTFAAFRRREGATPAPRSDGAVLYDMSRKRRSPK